MTAPPDRIARYDLDGNNGLMPSALGRLVEYRDHLTALDAAEARGREQAAELVLARGVCSNAIPLEAFRALMKICADLILAPPAPKETP